MIYGTLSWNNFLVVIMILGWFNYLWKNLNFILLQILFKCFSYCNLIFLLNSVVDIEFLLLLEISNFGLVRITSQGLLVIGIRV